MSNDFVDVKSTLNLHLIPNFARIRQSVVKHETINLSVLVYFCANYWCFFHLSGRLLAAPKDINLLRPRRNRCYNADDIFKCIFLKENVWISTKISLKFVPKGPINNIPALVQIMAWRRPGDKPLSEPMMLSSLTHICVTRPQWVNHFALHPGIYWEKL